jgi:autophagy-related protein 11
MHIALPGAHGMHRAGNLEQVISNETGIDVDAVLAFLSDGRRLQTDSIRELAGAQDQVRTPQFVV